MPVEVELRDDGISVVSMNWPEKRNALGPEDTREVGVALEHAVTQAHIGTILTGVGAFCAGGDLEEFVELSKALSVEQIRDRIYGNVHLVLRAIKHSPVPVAAVVNGPAVGLGFDYALACDMCFVGQNGWFQQGWAVAGLIHGAGGSAFLQRTAGQHFWKLVAQQERLDAHEAANLGIGERIEDDALDAAANRLLELGQLPREVREAYVHLYRVQRWPSPDFFEQCADLQARFIGSESFRDRAQSILNRRRQAQA